MPRKRNYDIYEIDTENEIPIDQFTKSDLEPFQKSLSIAQFSPIPSYARDVND